MIPEIIINQTLAKKVLKVVDKGLVSGLGIQQEGKMCVEAAVCYALGLPHGDNPPCVGSAVRNFKISLNDCWWPSNKDRTQGMRKLAVAQLGSNTIDQGKFLEILGYKCITQILPIILENALKEDAEKDFAPESKDLKEIIEKLKVAKDYKKAGEIAEAAWKIYSASAYASAYAYAFVFAFAYAYASASAFAFASAYAYAKKNPIFALQILNMTAQAGLEALIELKSPGCEFLNLCD